MAGLLDYLFDPGTYSQGGLLSRLQPSLSQIPQSQGFDQSNPIDSAQWPYGPVGAPSGQATPIAVGNNQMPRVGQMADFTPVPTGEATIPPNAQPAQGQLPAQQPSFGPGFSENPILRGIQSVANGGGLISALTGNYNDPRSVQQQNQRQLFQAYVGAGLTPNQAMVAVLNPQAATNLLGGGQTDDIKEYQFAKREEPNLTFQQFMQRKRAVSGEYSLTPQYGTDKDGNTVLIQTGKSGEAIQTKLPEGVKISSGVDKVDLGTTWGIIDKRTGQLVGQQPKDLQGKEAAEERGKAQGQAQAAVPGAIADAEATKAKIDELMKHEGLSSIVGSLDQYRPTWMLGEKGNDALARYKQLQGQAFLQAYNLLKGGGAITDIEGKKAEAAMARLDRAQSEEVFKQALQDFRDAIESGVNKLKAKAGGGSAAPATPAAATPSVNDLLKKYGGQ
ncbi:hypothetical protein JQ628_11305 [Bradyrhizobium lablabi]|uniref:hypothetical protein n=1 Tax=Bradyrhizobium lablabi TaxID=722472 RepID=UPI001BAB6409|nr:hypothetical protein [Bradyrhizobium lablabi]MBR1122103.1 hypothetical protein [Bradyrhizobium lablabi]